MLHTPKASRPRRNPRHGVARNPKPSALVMKAADTFEGIATEHAQRWPAWRAMEALVQKARPRASHDRVHELLEEALVEVCDRRSPATPTALFLLALTHRHGPTDQALLDDDVAWWKEHVRIYRRRLEVLSRLHRQGKTRVPGRRGDWKRGVLDLVQEALQWAERRLREAQEDR